MSQAYVRRELCQEDSVLGPLYKYCHDWKSNPPVITIVRVVIFESNYVLAYCVLGRGREFGS